MIGVRVAARLVTGTMVLALAACGSGPAPGAATVIFQTATDQVGGPTYYPADKRAPTGAQVACSGGMATITQPWGRHGDAIDSVSDFSSLTIKLPLNQGQRTHISLSHSAYKSSDEWSGTAPLEISQSNPLRGRIVVPVGAGGAVAGLLTVTFACP